MRSGLLDRTLLFAVLCVASATLPSCVPASSAPGDAGHSAGLDAGSRDAATLPATAYCESIVEPFCSFYLRCGRMAVDDEAACHAAFAPACEARFEPSWSALADAGLVALSREGLRECSTHLAAVPCEQQVRELDGPCRALWQGAVSQGGACGLDPLGAQAFVCAPGTTCSLGLDLCGICENIVDDGAPCDVPGSACHPDSACVQGVCKARVPIGEACGDDDRCAAGGSCEAGVCRSFAIVREGDACDLDHRCPYETACIAGMCERVRGDGASCTSDAQCRSGPCAQRVCARPLPAGSACTRAAECETLSCVGGRCLTLPTECVRPD